MANKKTGKGKVNASTREKKEMEATVAEQVKQHAVSQLIQKVLEDAGYALQPFISYSEFGLVPRVRLVANKQDNVEQGTDSKEAEGDRNEDGTAEPTQS